MIVATHSTYYYSPIGIIGITGSEEGICSVRFCDIAGGKTPELPQSMIDCVSQLEAYFHGELRQFDLPLLPEGTTFQKQVWEHLKLIPYGATTSYLSVSKAVSGPKAIRAVGAANGKNPLCIIVPCHRVIGSDRSLVGYAGGLWRKEWLLQHEGVLQPKPEQLSLF
ncbi:methylated-DNA--[protein]-cysteine S-methyltransferase [Pontibacter sp. SGAir0037]|uniref:methylated-DNA--[protein]-cysteine S-methyltransferase n=1 Tax=Pontibacter sp. SGAir0037 TaxID=2571030 RepID=UPI0010CD447A|nr:methylated-DNA--[protein]-cysteine S-methyltransferase [Pontibacter sp. SGAir0037]QCR23239.1 cysteine methyltransferase [Pontibacter sp. SGAir0037]